MRKYEFTWARIPLRRLSIGFWTEMDIDDNVPEKMGALGGGISSSLFPLLAGERGPAGIFLDSRIGGIQTFDETWGRHGGTFMAYGEAGVYAQLGSGLILIPRAAVRRTAYLGMRHGKEVSNRVENGIHAGFEFRLQTVMPGIFVYASDRQRELHFSLRFAYQ